MATNSAYLSFHSRTYTWIDHLTSQLNIYIAYLFRKLFFLFLGFLCLVFVFLYFCLDRCSLIRWLLFINHLYILITWTRFFLLTFDLSQFYLRSKSNNLIYFLRFITFDFGVLFPFSFLFLSFFSGSCGFIIITAFRWGVSVNFLLFRLSLWFFSLRYFFLFRFSLLLSLLFFNSFRVFYLRRGNSTALFLLFFLHYLVFWIVSISLISNHLKLNLIIVNWY